MRRANSSCCSGTGVLVFATNNNTGFTGTLEFAQGSIRTGVPSVAPSYTAKYLQKTECFCFTPQDFGPAQEREFTVRFIVDPDLPPQVDRMTLAYSMYTLPERKLAAR